jgi:DNA modification methylase
MDRRLEKPEPPTRPIPSLGHNSRGRRAAQRKLVIDYIPTDQLKPDGRAARVHTPKQVGQIVSSIGEFGFLIPILGDAEDRVICGHARLMAASKIGLPEVPVIRVEHLTPAQIRAFQIAENKLTENATWDERLLGEAFRDLALSELDFDLEVTGFETAEIDSLIVNLDGAADDPDDELPPAGPLVTRPGDVWEVLGHRIVCGDARIEASYRALMGDERAAVVITDPPYNVPTQGHIGGRGKIKHASFIMAAGEMSEAEFTAFLLEAFLRMAAVCAPGALAYTFSDWRHLPEAFAAGRRAFVGLKNICVWAKTMAGQGSFYRSQHEMVLVFQVSAGKTRNNVQLGRFGRSRSNLWTYASPASFGHTGEEGRLLEEHPCPKPVALIADAILDCTARGDIVLDPFLGGGAAAIAAERTGRRCRGIEIEPKFVDAAIRRLRRLSGEDARRVKDGRMFADLEREAADGH